MDRLERLHDQLAQRGLDCLALVPGANLFYLTGLQFHLSERPIVAFFPLDEPPAIVLPELESVKLEGETFPDLEAFTYTDEEGYTGAFQQACAALELADSIVGVEAFHMRVAELRLLERYAPGSQLQSADECVAAMRLIKEAGEIEATRRAIAISEQALRETLPLLHTGMTERQIAGELEAATRRLGAEGDAFTPIVLSGPNSASPHAHGGDRALAAGDLLLFDFGVTVAGYASDITRTFCAGQPDPELARVYEVVRQANAAALAAARPGVACKDIDRAARDVIAAAGYGEFFIHRTGHGLGLEGHEPPYIVAGNAQRLAPGMLFTIEPGVYLPGKGGVRIEDDVLVTAGGAESLTTFPREMQGVAVGNRQ
jgi:Xaa-Pro dipeptidase